MRRLGTAVILRSALTTFALGLAGVLYGFPLYWLFITSLKSKGELFASTVHLIPHNPTFAAYSSVLIDRGFWVLLKNSVVVCVSTVLVTLVVGLVITYPLTRLPVPARLRVGVLNWALSLRFLPPIAVVIRHDMAAAVVLAMALPLVLMVIGRRYIVAGLTFGVIREK